MAEIVRFVPQDFNARMDARLGIEAIDAELSELLDRYEWEEPPDAARVDCLLAERKRLSALPPLSTPADPSA